MKEIGMSTLGEIREWGAITRYKRRLIPTILTVAMLSGAAHATEYFVKEDGDDGDSGHDWENALATVAAAVAKADSTIVTIRAGTYDQSAEIELYKAITVRSEIGGLAGAADTIVRRTGGAAFRIFRLSHADAAVEGLTVAGGESQLGGGIYMTAGTVTNCVITGNSASVSSSNTGGGIWASGGLIYNTVVTNNTGESASNASITGTGAYLSGTAVMDRCLVAYNETSDGRHRYGGGVYLANSAIARNSLIRNNKISSTQVVQGGGVYIRDDGLLENCTVVANTATATNEGDHSFGGGVYVDSDSGEVRNSIVYFNIAAFDNNYSGPATSLSYSCTEVLIDNTGNIAANPLFVDADTGDFRLRYESPLVDAGLDDPTWMNDGADLAGNARISGEAVDMGAYEYVVGSEFAVRILPTADRIGHLELTDLEIEAVLTRTEEPTTYEWTVGGETFSGIGKSTVTNTFAPGSYTVTLTVSNAVDGVYEMVREGYVRVYGDEIHVKSDGSAEFPYATAATAATNFPAAHAAIRDMQLIGEPVRVKVYPGEWATDGSIALTGDSVVQGINGASETILYRPETGSAMFRISHLSHPKAMLAGLTVRDGVEALGGGIYMTAGTVSNCVVTGNSASVHSSNTGGGIWASGGLIYNTVVTNNTGESASNANITGTGAYLAGTAVMDRCLVAYNGTSDGRRRYGGGVYLAGSAIARNSLIRNNKISSTQVVQGGGVYISDNGLLENCTVVANTATATSDDHEAFGGGVYVDSDSGEVRNSIVYFNTAAFGNNYFGPATSLRYSNTEPFVDNTGNLAVDPLFVDVDADNFRLPFDSPCVSAGTNDAWMVTGTDLDGNARISGETVDMGAYEYIVGSEFAAMILPMFDTIGYLELVDLEIKAVLVGTQEQTEDVFCEWTIGKETITGTDLLTVTRTFGPGSYDLRLTVSNMLSDVYEIVREGYIRVGGGEIHVSSGGMAIYPYATLETAATNFPAAHGAIDDMQSFDAPVRVWVHDGDWAVDRRVELSGDSILRSVNGPDSAALYRPEYDFLHSVAGLSHSNAVLAGLTIRGGQYPEGGGIRMTAGTVTNCVVTGNATPSFGHTYGGGIWASGGFIRNTTITNNSASSTGNQSASGTGAYLSGTVIMDGCLVAYNETDDGRQRYGGGLFLKDSAIARNCLIRNNKILSTGSSHVRRGGGVYIEDDGVLENCTVVANEALVTDGSGGGVYVVSGTVRSSIIVGNLATTDNNYSGPAENLTYSCATDPIVAGETNIADDPLFEDVTIHDYRLQRESPAIDKGHPGPYEGDLAWIAEPDAVDFDGSPRLVGTAVDMGAFETLIPPAGTLFLIR